MRSHVLHVFHTVQSLDGDALSVIENPAAVNQHFHSESTAGVAGTKGEPGWLNGIQSRSYSKKHQKPIATGVRAGT